MTHIALHIPAYDKHYCGGTQALSLFVARKHHAALDTNLQQFVFVPNPTILFWPNICRDFVHKGSYSAKSVNAEELQCLSCAAVDSSCSLQCCLDFFWMLSGSH